MVRGGRPTLPNVASSGFLSLSPPSKHLQQQVQAGERGASQALCRGPTRRRADQQARPCLISRQRPTTTSSSSPHRHHHQQLLGAEVMAVMLKGERERLTCLR